MTPRTDNCHANAIKMLAGTLTDDPYYPASDTPVNQEVLADDAAPNGVVSEWDAWNWYVKTVAMSLAVEMTRYVPWSISSYDPESLAALFDSRNSLSYTWPERGTVFGSTAPRAEGYAWLANNYDRQTHKILSPYLSAVTPATPLTALTFIRDKGFLQPTRLATIYKIVDWTRFLQHYILGASASRFEQIWGYRGPAPVSRTIDATVDTENSVNLYHYTAGCHGTSEFLHSILRIVNIPVDNSNVGHSVTHFMTDGVYLSHGDDPYLGADFFGVPLGGFLISESTYQEWFANTTPNQAFANVSRGTTESKIKYLSGELQWDYCSDPNGNSDHANSWVFRANMFAIKRDIYSLSYLENLPADPENPSLPPSLWDRLAQKVAAAGGCDAVIASIKQQMRMCPWPPPDAIVCGYVTPQ